MSNETNETIADIVSEVRRVAYNVAVADANTLNGWRPAAFLSMLADRIEAVHERELADEKRISEAVVQSMRDKKLEMAGEIAAKDEEIAGLRALVKEFADVLNDTKNYICFDCPVRNCPGEYDCRDTKKYCLLIAKAREVIGGTK